MQKTTLRTDLAALLADVGIIDVDIDKAVEDEHLRGSIYRRIIAVVAASQRRDEDRRIVSTILRDPEKLTAKAAVVELVDKIAMKTADFATFRQWTTEQLTEIDLLEPENGRKFIRRRIHDWLCYLSIKDGRVPAPAELANVTDWMQRMLAEESMSPPALTLLAESGNTKKIRNIAKNRVRSRELRVADGHRPAAASPASTPLAHSSRDSIPHVPLNDPRHDQNPG